MAADDLGHHRRRGGGDGAALALERGVLDHAVITHLQIHRDNVAAERVVAPGLAVGAVRVAEVPGVPAVIENHFLVQIAQVVEHQAKNSRTP
jgi:hypothetical protein